MGQFDVIPFYNYTDTSFSFQYNDEGYSIRSGETKYWPPFIAYHGAKHLIDREFIRAGKINLLNDNKEREKYLNRILIAREKQPEEPVIEEAPIQVEEEFPDLEKISPSKSKKVDLSRKELFARVKELGIKQRATVSNEELKRIIKENESRSANTSVETSSTNTANV
jgi:hypothetical protein